MKKTKSMLFGLAVIVSGFTACEPQTNFLRGGDGEGTVPIDLVGQINPFEDPSLNPGGGNGDGDDDSDGITPGTSGQSTQDVFTQAQVAKADILIVVDTSGSMSNEQKVLASNANRLVAELTNAAIDYRVALITTSANTDSELHNLCGGGDYLTSANISLLADCIKSLGLRGSGYEHGLEAARRALDPQYPRGPWNSAATPAPLNPNFLRTGAKLTMIMFSDEEAQSNFDLTGSRSWSNYGFSEAEITGLRSEAAPRLLDSGLPADSRFAFFPKVANYVQFFDALSTVGTHSQVHAIVGLTEDSSACSAGNSLTAEIGQTYDAVAKFTSGTSAEICDGDSIGIVLTELGLQATGLNNKFDLSKVPTDISSIVVSVNGVALPAAEVSYVVTGNQVYTKNFAAAGSTIVITYL